MSELTERMFRTTIRNEDYIMRDHRLHGVRVLPGVTLIDLVYRCLGATGIAQARLELRNLLFSEPVATSEQFDQALEIRTARDNGAWKATIGTRPVKDGRILREEPRIVFQAELALTAEPEPERIDLAGLIAQATQRIDIGKIYEGARQLDIRHFEFMTGHGTVHEGANFALAEVSLGALARQHRKDFYIHPVYLDVSTGIPFFIRRAAANTPNRPYIPLFIERLRAYRRLEDPSFAYVARQGNEDRFGDLLSDDVKIYDASGRLAVLMQGLKLKRVRTEQLIQSLVSGAADPPAPREISSPDMVQELKQMIGGILGREADSIRTDASFYDLGLESSDLTGMVAKLEAKAGRQLYPTLLFEYPNVEALAKYLSEECGGTLQAGASNSEPARTSQTLLYTPVWNERAISAGNEAAVPDLIFDTEESVWQAACSRRPATILVKPGAAFRQAGPNLFEMRPDRGEDYHALFRSLAEMGIKPGTILHLWNFRNEDAPASLDARLAAARRRIEMGIASILLLTRAAREVHARAGLKLLAAGGPANSPETGALAALFQTIAREAPALDYRLVRFQEAADARQLMEAAREFSGEAPASRHVLYKGGKRYCAELEAAAPKGEARPGIRTGGTYLITGGLGGLGLLMARHLATRYRANLVLLGRSALTATGQAALEALREAGSDVRYFRADVADAAAVAAALAEAKKQSGRIDGIIHCAGVVEDALFFNKDERSLERVLGPKVSGTVILDYLTQDEPLDFLATFSSISAVLGNPGQADYAFANAFMDQYASAREALRAEGLRSGISCSIAWPLWESVGIQLSEELRAAKLGRFGLAPLPAADGLETFERIMGLGLERVTVLHGDPARIQEWLQPAGAEPQPIGPEAPAPGPVQKNGKEPIAIIGLAGRYPGAADMGELWQALREGRDLVTEVPRDRWEHAAYYDPQRGKKGKTYSKWGGFLEDFDKFDPLFFNLSPLEAEMMDPQERVFLETAWSAIEDAGYTPETLGRSAAGEDPHHVGVFAGVMWSDYQLHGHEETLAGNPVLANSWFSMIPNRVSYLLDFHGPSMPVDTACSSSLVALHLACRSIENGECAVALAGGVNLSLHPSKYVKTSQLQMHSSDGRCRSFGEGGDGYVPGEGAGAVVLKPLARALADGDHIYAVIRGTEVRHGGRTSGFAVPNPHAQAALISANLAQSGTDARTISYVEAHGTGTALGDPIEVRGLSEAFRKHTDARNFCALGSVKSNMGHLESAAGISALTKVLLQMEHKEVVPTLHASKPNSHIDFANSPFYLPQKPEDWKRPQVVENGREVVYPRRAAVSSFGAGGVNAHVVLEEYERPAGAAATARGPALFPLSARDAERLRDYCVRFKRFLDRLDTDASGGPELQDIAYTLQVGRLALEERVAFVASSREELAGKVDAYLGGRARPETYTGSAKAGAEIAEVLKDGPEARRFLEGLAERKDLCRLARLWVNGVAIDWRVLHAGSARLRCPLPTYPFARERYWLSGAPESGRRVTVRIARHGEPEPPFQEGMAGFEDGERNGSASGAAWWADRVSESLTKSCEQYLKELLSSEIKLAAHKIDSGKPVLDFGVDSVILMKLKTALEAEFGELPVMLFFDYKSIGELAAYFAGNHAARAQQMFGEALCVCDGAD